MITVRLPLALQLGTRPTIVVAEPVRTLGALVEALERRMPGFRDQLEDSVFNFAVNDELVLHQARTRALADGDRVEIIPVISGG
jgi:molybdopterin converting factor small subunit